MIINNCKKEDVINYKNKLLQQKHKHNLLVKYKIENGIEHKEIGLDNLIIDNIAVKDASDPNLAIKLKSIVSLASVVIK